jgi:hypothetical protein
MPFRKGDAKPPGSGREKGQANKSTIEIKAALAKHVPEMVKELVRLATEAENEATRVAAIKEVFDRAIGKAVQPVETEVQFGISAELQRLLQDVDGQSRSIPATSDRPGANGTLLALPAPNGQQPH